MDRRLLLVLAVLLVVAGLALTNALFVVDQVEQALVLQFGQPRRVIRTPGLWVKRPFLEDVKRYDNRLSISSCHPKKSSSRIRNVSSSILIRDTALLIRCCSIRPSIPKSGCAPG
jgi:regulator of protease activity HflC (stomatin/prohibitin superfamily)